jgi:hypothetical protein
MLSIDLVRHHSTDEFELQQAGGVVWLNNCTGLIARYHPQRGIDIHTTGTCGYCRTGAQDFNDFVAMVLEYHSIDLTKFTQPAADAI